MLQTMTRDLNVAKREGEPLRAAQIAAELRVLAGVLGIAQLPAEEWARLRTPSVDGDAAPGAGPDDEAITDLVARRLAARKSRDFKEADRIRDLLASQGVVLEDRPDGRTEWRRA